MTFELELVSIVSRWLSPSEKISTQPEVAKREEKEKWLLNSPYYETWHCGDQRTLFCLDISGIQKTVVSSIVIDDLQMRFGDEAEIRIAHLFCKFKQQIKQTPRDLFASLLRQLVERQLVMPEAVETLYKRHI